MPSEPDSSLDVPPALSGSGWYRTPSGGWSGASVSPQAIPQHALPAILAVAGGQVQGLQQLPFPGFPPVNYQPADLSSCGVPGCRTSGSVSYHACPAISCDRDRFKEIRDKPQPQPQQQPRQASSQSSVAESLPFQRRERSTSRLKNRQKTSLLVSLIKLLNFTISPANVASVLTTRRLSALLLMPGMMKRCFRLLGWNITASYLGFAHLTLFFSRTHMYVTQIVLSWHVSGVYGKLFFIRL